MTEPPVGTRDLADPVFFGLLEGICFFLLFVSPLLVGPESLRIWLAIALLRVVVLAAALLPGRGGGERTRPWLQILAQATLYQIPFWISALFFPLRTGQSEHALMAIGVQLALSFSLALILRWGTGLCGVETVVYLISLGWVLAWRPAGGWLVPAGLGLLLTLRVFSGPRSWGWELTRRQALAVGMAWMAGFVFPWFEPAWAFTAGPTLLLWSLLIYLGAVVVVLQREAGGDPDVLAGLPACRAAQAWLVGRRSAGALLGWLAMPVLLIARPQDGIAWLLLFCAWARGVELAARGWFNPDRVIWWAALEVTLVWLALGSAADQALGILALSVLLAGRALARRFSPLAPALAIPWSGQLEQHLRTDLPQAAPSTLAQRLRAESASMVLDKDLAAQAPAGFRDRLMQRLRQSDDDQD